MLSIAVKNSLMIIVFILILHLIIKRYLVEQYTQSPTACPATHSEPAPVIIDSTNAAPVNAPTADLKPKNILEASEGSKSKVPEGSKSASEEELYNFIFNDNKPPAGACEAPKETPYVPEPATIKGARPPSANSIQNDQMIINEYESEMSMNGGALFGGLSAFDASAGNYVAYEPLAC